MRARLINPRTVLIRPIARSSTRIDDLLREPSTYIARGDLVEIPAQVDVISENRRAMYPGGARLDAQADVVFLRRDLTRLGYSPADGDFMIGYRDRAGLITTCNWYLELAKPDAAEFHADKTVTAVAKTRPPSRTVKEGL